MSITTVLLGLGAAALTLFASWWLGRLGDAKDKGRREVQDAITKQAIEAKKREAEEYSKPRSDNWNDIISGL